MIYRGSLYEKLMDNAGSDVYPFHMPGHKRNTYLMPQIDPYAIDITEIDGFDDLHHADGCIRNSERKAAELFGAEETHFLINGCTGGILAAVSACTGPQDTILLARNAHRSAYNALIINRLRPEYIWPRCGKYDIAGGISVAQVEEALRKNRDISCVFITSPTYEGVVSDVADIARVAHLYGIPLIVDEAHGAHMGFCDIFPDSAISQGADIVINGIHKTLPSFTQTALIHVQGGIVDRNRLKKYLSVYQSSSPSYILMGSIDYAMTYLCHEGVRKYAEYKNMLIEVYERISQLKNIRILPYSKERDASKIVVITCGTGMSGQRLYDILRNRYGLQPEMSSPGYVILMTSICDSHEGFERLCEALYQIDDCLDLHDNSAVKGMSYEISDVVLAPYEAGEYKSRCVRIPECEGLVSAEMLYVYPPGIPLVVPGERITKDALSVIMKYKDMGYELHGTCGPDGEYIRVCDGSL